MEAHSMQDPAMPEGSAQFVSRMPGKVSIPSDELYETARLAWNRTVDQRPAMIVYVESPLDVIEAVSYARRHQLPVAVQSTGHGVVRKADGAMLINTSRMQELHVDPQKQTAWVGAGVKWGAVLAEAQQHGLAPLLGSSPDVGVVGYSLGGGMGWLARKYGMSADSIIRLEVVTPDGEYRTVSADENSDLFWALRGGGGGFGVVTGVEIKLHPVSQVYAGNIYYPAAMAKEVIHRFREWTANAPRELTASVVVMNFPPLPEIPPVFSGQSYVIVRGCYCGPVEDGVGLMEYWRGWQTPAVDDFKPIPFSQAEVISNDPIDPMPSRHSGAWMHSLTDEGIDTIIQYTLPQGGPPPLVFTEVRLAGGAIADPDPDSCALSHRDSKYILVSVAVVMGPEHGQLIDQHLDQMHEALAACLTGKVYPNFVEGNEALQRSRDGFSEEAFRRLQAIKARYDPDNRFRHSYDIPTQG